MSESLFDFERDIAPERNNFGFTRTESAFLNAKADQQIMPQLDLMVKLRGQLQKERASDLAYETSVFEFKQRKKTLREQRDSDIRAEELLKPIQDIVENDQLNEFERVEQLNILQLQNPEVFANSKVAQQSAAAANRFLASKMKQRDEKLVKERKEEEEQKKRLDTTGFDINSLFSYETDEQVQELEDFYKSPDSDDGEDFSPREQANVRTARFAAKKNQAEKLERERKEKESLTKQMFSNQFEAGKLSLNDLDDIQKRVGDAVKSGTYMTNQEKAKALEPFQGLVVGEGTDAEATLSGTTREELDKSINDARSNLIKKLTKLRMDQNKFLNARFRELGGVPATSKPKRPTSKKEQQKDSKRSELKNLINP